MGFVDKEREEGKSKGELWVFTDVDLEMEGKEGRLGRDMGMLEMEAIVH